MESQNYQKEQHKQTVAINDDDVPLPFSICVYVLLYVDLVLVKVDYLFRYALEVPPGIVLLKD